MRRAKEKLSISEKLFISIVYIIMILFLLLCLYPFYYLLIYSISDATEAAKGVYLFPAKLDFTTYVGILKRNDLLHALFISSARTVLGTIITVFCTSVLAYLFTKNEMLFRKAMYRFLLITMYVGAGFIPWYITMKAYGLKNNFLLYIIPGAVNVFQLILVKTFIEQLPASLEESAELDGAGFFTVFIRIIFPLSMPIIATISVFSAVGHWGSWIDNYFLANTKGLMTLQLVLYNYLNQAQAIAEAMKRSGPVAVDMGNKHTLTADSVRMTITFISVVPIMLVYPFLQRYFVKGIMMGAIKG